MMTRQRVSRRDVLKTGIATVTGAAAGAVSALGLPSVSAQDATRKDFSGTVIDAHSHIWTRDVKSFPLAAGQTVDDLKPPSFTAEELIAVAEKNGVHRVVLIQHHTYHGWDNSYLIHAARQHAERFRVVGMVDDTAPHPDRTMRSLLKQRVTGFRITPWNRGSDKWLTGDGMEAMWRCAAETGQSMCCLIDAGDLENVDAMCRRHPDTRVVIDHFARIGVDGVIRDADVNRLCALARHRNVYVKISAYYALGKKRAPYHDLIPMIRRVLDAYGPQRLMWASDSPYQVVGGHTYRDSIELVRHGLDFVTTSDRDWLLRRTAEQVYFL